MGNNISFELHHKDGNKLNNSRDNLEILCPNCHSQTPNYRFSVFAPESSKKRVATNLIPR